MKIAIVGTGISGLVCAHLLHADHDITVFEADDRIGGHANTVTVELPRRSSKEPEVHQVDTGFIVYNERNYPNFTRLLDQLGVPTQPGEMSFSVSDPRIGLEYRGTNLNTLYAQRANLTKPWFARMLIDILRFNRTARALVEQDDPADHDHQAHVLTLADVVEQGGFSDAFVERFLVPLGSSIWSADTGTFTRFPAAAYARFMDNHGLLRLSGMPTWRTISGGSRRYVEALTTPFADRIRLCSPVDKIVRRHHGPQGAEVEVEITSPSGGLETFDRVILATHSDQALRLLSDAGPTEREVLGAIRYQPNVATLHTDERFLPRNRRARASWNYHLGTEPDTGSAPHATLTYWMNALQSLESEHQILVTLNRHDEVAPDRVLARFDYDHPVFDAAAMAAQARRHEVQGVDGTFFAGAYWGFGFHEDGVRSALDVCRHFGATL